MTRTSAGTRCGALLLWLAAFGALAGCGSGGGTAATVDPVAETNTARGQLGTLIAATPSVTTGSVAALDIAQLQSIRTEFARANGADPADAQAAFGLAVTDLAINAETAADLLPTKSARVIGRSASITTNPLQTLVTHAEIWSLAGAETTTLGRRSAVNLAAIPAARLRAATTGTEITLTTALNGLLAALNRDLPLITQAANSSTFTFPLPGVGGTGQTTVIDQADARAFEAALYGVRAGVDMALAYNVDPGGYNVAEPLAQAFPAATAGETITPAQYLPPAPFGQLVSNGSALLEGAKSDLGTAITVTQADVPLLQARTGSTLHLIPSGSITSQEYSDLGVALIAAGYALDHSFSTGGLTFDIPAWFDNPPASLASLEPTYHFDGTSYIAAESDYPDPTFGGLVSGVPAGDYAVSVPARAGTLGDLATDGVSSTLEAAIPTDLSEL